MNRRGFLKAIGAGALTLTSPFIFNSCQATGKGKRPNVLFIAVDDLRPELGCYENPYIKSPNIDALASDGFLFNNSFCQVPVCGASRASLLSGLRPNRNRFTNFSSRVDKDAPCIVTLPKHFKNNGYYTLANGKVFHHKPDCEDSWSEPVWTPKGRWRDYQTAANIKLGSQDNKKFLANATELADVDDYTYIDGKVAKKSIDDLAKLRDMNQPFFLAAGFRKPHLPFNAPKKYWEMYDKAAIRAAENPYIPKGAPAASIHDSFELRAYKDIPDTGKISDQKAKQLKHGYYECVSYFDALIGELITELKQLKLYDDTIIILWGDHGFQLGEHTMWCKHCNYETSLKAPMIVRVPGMNNNIQIDGLTEFVDIYPSLCELVGLNFPTHLEGDSFVPLLNGSKQKLKDAVFSRFGEGESVRTERYLYTEFVNAKGELYAKMLYDHKTDPAENKNIVELKENRELVQDLSEMLTRHREKYYN